MDEYQLAWCMFFSAVKGWQYHPGNRSTFNTRECAAIADDMLDEYKLRKEPNHGLDGSSTDRRRTG